MRDTVVVDVEKIYEDVELPSYKFENDSGMDVRAYFSEKWAMDNRCWKNVDGKMTINLGPLSRILIPTGLKVAIPNGYEIQVRPRSGLSLKNGITVLNAPGTIDADYRNEIGIILFNSCRPATEEYVKQNHFPISHGDRIAQLVLQKVPAITWNIVKNVNDSARGLGGFGSTGKA